MAPSQGSRAMSLPRADLAAGEAAVDLAVAAAAASAVGWPADSSNSNPVTSQFIGFIIVFKARIKTDVSFFATRAPVKHPRAFFMHF